MNLDTTQLGRCLQTLEASLSHLNGASPASIEYEVFRNAVVKGFELSLEIAGKLLRKALREYLGNPRDIESLSYKDVIRNAAKHGLMDVSAVERWFAYRDNRNSTAHDYGLGFAEDTLRLLPGFLDDAHALEASLHNRMEPGNA